jgi:hypothetical protein
MTAGGTPENGRSRNRFVIGKDDIEVTGHRDPTAEELDEADRLFNRILKRRKQKPGQE